MKQPKSTSPNPLFTPKEISDYDMRVKAMTLATQHSRNCNRSTLVKLAESIYKWLKGEKQDLKED